eukprot:maker-scaffold_14-snap-gene-4.47-mRNA-1 protein AED:0.03 eAED:0.03 QI:181/1/1/1/1/1/3/27/671
MSLDSILPGDPAQYFCEQSQKNCSLDPIAYKTILLFILTNLNSFSERFLSLLVGCFVVNSLAQASQITPPLYLWQFIGFLALLSHLPGFTSSESRIFLSFCLGFVLALLTNQVRSFETIAFLYTLYCFFMKVIKITVTGVSSNHGATFFPIIQHVVPKYSFTPHQFFRADRCSDEVARVRAAAFDKMKLSWDKKYPAGLEMSQELAKTFSDLRFTGGNRVFLPFMEMLSRWCDPTTIVESSKGPTLKDIDQNELVDISGSYGVNVCGYEKYKEFITEGWKKVDSLGCVLGPLHPLVLDNIRMLRSISKKEEVSFHMSGTEAVMCAVRLCRFNTSRKFAVVFAGAYHGWWDGVQNLAGNERVPNDVLTLKDMATASLSVLQMRKVEIACVLVNPLQAFHPNSPPPSDVVLASNLRSAKKGKQASESYKIWLNKLRRTCSKCSIPLVFDEVYTGFRLAPGGAQEYFGVDADMVVYGKSLGGGIPNGVVCGPHTLMRRSDPVKPLRQAYVIGTFSAHPLLMGSMNVFLNYITTDEARNKYESLRQLAAEWVEKMNLRLEREGMPLRLQTYASVWTMLFLVPGRYHWMLQYYLKDEGANLSWVGTGRLSFSHDFTEKDMEKLSGTILRACKRMQEDGWWTEEVSDSERKQKDMEIKLSLVKEVGKALAKRIIGFS